MSGEKQPGGRAPAPGELALVQAFITTHYDLVHEHGAEVLSGPDAMRSWLAGHGLVDSEAPVSHADVRRLLAVREALRELARADPDDRALAPLHAAVELRLEPEGPRLEPSDTSEVDRAIAALLAIVAREMLIGRWSRLKVCPGHDCGWAFYDESRNRTGRWCSMSICGSRAKARAHYRRQRGAA
jgi:predicted RNA-binding Zn ribbon-like protein